MDLFELVRGYSRVIKNGRSHGQVFDHMLGEADELRDELDLRAAGRPPGPDGIVGEAIDVALCALDLVYLEQPNITAAEVHAIAARKCEKWRAKAAA